jgi:hypothetical protein
MVGILLPPCVLSRPSVLHVALGIEPAALTIEAMGQLVTDGRLPVDGLFWLGVCSQIWTTGAIAQLSELV